MLRIGVTGRTGQVAQSLCERGPEQLAEIVVMARPDFHLFDANCVARAVEAAGCDVIVNAAAYTAVDRAEAEPELAMAINADGARHVAMAAKAVGIPVIQISTDYVFDGQATRPYREDDTPKPLGAYGKSKLAGERAVAETCADHVILRTAWVYSAVGQNFVRTMLRLGETRTSVSLVADQFGCPTYAPDLADAVISIAAQLFAKPEVAALRGISHAPGGGEASWADFGEAIFSGSARRGCEAVHVNRIAKEDYPTAARRPTNSRLDAHKLEAVYGLKLPSWRQSLDTCLDRLFATLNAIPFHENTIKEGK